MENSKIKPDMHAFMRELLEEIIDEKGISEESLRKWFGRKGAPGKKGGWVDCNAPKYKDGKKVGYKSCGRQKGEKRSKYPACRPTASQCSSKGKGKSWGKKSKTTKETKEAPDGTYFTKSGNLVKGRMTKAAKERGARLSDPKDKQRSKVPPITQYTETANPQDGKAAPYGSGYRKVSKKQIHELVHQILTEKKKKKKKKKKVKRDACYYKVKSRYDVWPSAYGSGQLVQCREKGAKNWGNKTKK